MKINTNKCKTISSSPINITIENENIEVAEEFKFLGPIVSNSSHDVKRRTAMTNSVFGRLKNNVETMIIQQIDTAYCNEI